MLIRKKKKKEERKREKIKGKRKREGKGNTQEVRENYFTAFPSYFIIAQILLYFVIFLRFIRK